MAGYNAENLLMTFDDQLKRIFDTAVAELIELTGSERKQARQQGVEDGRAQGWDDGREQGRFEGRSEAEQESRVALEAAVEAVRAEALADLASLDRLLDAIRAIDRGRSLGEILETLVSCAARETARAGVLLVHGDRLRGWRFAGFDGPDDERTGDLPLDQAGILADAMRSGAVASGAMSTAGFTSARAAAPRFANLETAEHSLAVPIVLSGEVVAVLYADQGRQSQSAARGRKIWPAVLEVLARHAARSLEALTAIKAARAMSGSGAAPPARSVTLAASETRPSVA